MDIKNKLENPNFFEENVVAPYSEALKTDSYSLQSLNGSWFFKFSDSLENCDAKYRTSPELCEKWDKIDVPAHINLSGYGCGQYLNTAYTWDGIEAITPPNIPSKIPVGQYMLKQSIKKITNGEAIRLRFNGVEPCFALWINGQYIGYSEDSFTQKEFDITAAVKEGENYIYAEVYRYCSGSWLEDQDFWRFWGIFRDVEMFVLPNIYIEDFFVKAQADGKLEINVKTHGAEVLSAQLCLPDGREVFSREINDIKNGEVNFSTTIQSPMLWSAQSPNLYKLHIKISAKNCKAQEHITNVGFRTIKIENSVFTINGKRAVLRGVNRHEWNEYGGRVLSYADMLQDACLMKQNNINAVRASHYPNNRAWYDICDEAGLYVIDEVNLETHGTWGIIREQYPVRLPLLPNDGPEFKNAVLQRAKNMLMRDKNHPCIIMWSCGNESMGGSVIYEESQLLRQLDDSRPIHYEGITHDDRYPDTTDIISSMYYPPEKCEETILANPQKPFMQCEYAHAMGNSCGALDEYVALEKHPQYVGGFIWDWIDQQINANGKMHSGGDFGELTHYGDFCANGLVFANRAPTPKLFAVKAAYSPFAITPQKSGIEIFNQNPFDTGEEYNLEISVLQNGEEFCKETKQINCKAQEKTFVEHTCALPEKGEIVLRARLLTINGTKFVSTNHEIACADTILRSRAQDESGWRAECGCEYVGLYNKNISAIFGVAKGNMSGLFLNDKLWLTSSFAPIFWRAPVSNDTASQLDCEKSVWKSASLYQRVVDFSVSDASRDYVISTVYELSSTPKTYCTVKYYFVKDEKIRITADMSIPQEMPSPFCFGICCNTLPENGHIKYYGHGPYETAPDRKNGALLGNWELDAQTELTPYMTLQESGLRSEVRNFECGGLKFTAEQPVYFSALNYTCHEIENAARTKALPPPTKTVLRILSNECGIGGDDTWGARPHKAYLMNERTYHLDFTISL